MNKKTIKVAFLGKPNAGKSTIINCFVKYDIASITPKANTTRFRAKYIAIHNDTQVIITDTPGIFDAQSDFHTKMIEAAWEAIKEVDIIAIILDVRNGLDNNFIEEIRLKTQPIKKKIIFIINKIDLATNTKIALLSDKLSLIEWVDKYFFISALKSADFNDILSYLELNAKSIGWLHDENQLSISPLRFFCEEITRESILNLIHDEIPHSIKIETLKWEENKFSVSVYQNILTNKLGHKKILVGKGASTLKKIGISARMKMIELIEKKVHLFLYVKIDERWQKKINKKEFSK